ncbi:MarR family winged helix-turn-helix transcriptional regulator [Fructilactobacillus frigidiflavus]|uniref:MarR family winged helix-turn-helix transcriptional regulator n=1 Tax=Fructilactobacillus frigidiflavus TaxID=3242688 RepID=UPI003757C087
MTDEAKRQQTAEKLIEFNALQDAIQEIDRKHLVSNPNTMRGQGKILLVLLQQDHISQKELAKKLNLTAQSTAEFVKKLEKKGLVSRHKSTQDRRITLVDLTPAGQTKALASVKNTMPFLKVLNDEELDQLNKIFTKINADLSQKIKTTDPNWQGQLHKLVTSVFEDWFGDD